MDYNSEGYLTMISRGILSFFDPPTKNNDKYILADIINRLEKAVNGSVLIELYCGVVGLDSVKLRKAIIRKNVFYLYKLKYKKKSYIKILNDAKKKKWVIS